MKKLIVLGFVLFAAFSCKKGEIPQICKNYVGEWNGAKSSTSDYALSIKPDGTATFSNPSTSGSGKIYFEGYDFKIGKRRKNTKFHTDSLPHKITITTKPYTYYQRATFNGVTYTDKPK